jgi:hypothetical protein
MQEWSDKIAPPKTTARGPSILSMIIEHLAPRKGLMSFFQKDSPQGYNLPAVLKEGLPKLFSHRELIPSSWLHSISTPA